MADVYSGFGWYILLILMTVLSSSAWLLVVDHFAQKVRRHFPFWTEKHVRSFIFGMAGARKVREKSLRRAGVPNDDTLNYTLAMQRRCLFLAYLAAVLTAAMIFMIFHVLRWI